MKTFANRIVAVCSICLLLGFDATIENGNGVVAIAAESSLSSSSSSSSSSRKQPRAKESAKKKKPTTINTTTSPLEASQRPPAIKSEENSKNTKKKTIIKTTPTIKKEKINDPREARNSGQKRKNAPGEAAVAIRRGTRRSPRFAKS
mmetsp:Transcript_15648/g.33856  ORF Transcript_15648/g.33856 Transcript_15648/m.33856 type:complete len:147 (+) Transcript_15648:317-757(+)